MRLATGGVGASLARSIRATGLLLAVLLSAPAVGAGDWEALVADGERWWSWPPDLDRPVACATCHHDPDAIRAWAGSFPKVRPMPPPHTRVMTLLQATAEAVTRHYGPRDARPVAVAISAFLAARGVGLPITPGVTPDQPVFHPNASAGRERRAGPEALRATVRGVPRRGHDRATGWGLSSYDR